MDFNDYMDLIVTFIAFIWAEWVWPLLLPSLGRTVEDPQGGKNRENCRSFGFFAKVPSLCLVVNPLTWPYLPVQNFEENHADCDHTHHHMNMEQSVQ